MNLPIGLFRFQVVGQNLSFGEKKKEYMRALGYWMVGCLFYLVQTNCWAQRTYEFNREGNICYFPYVEFAPNGQYDGQQPYIFVIGSGEQDPLTVYESDTLKYLPQFFGYTFIYVPHRRGKSLDCIDALATMISGNGWAAIRKRFLVVNDPSTTREMLISKGLSNYFANMRVASPIGSVQGGTPSVDSVQSIVDAFKVEVITTEETPGIRRRPIQNRVPYTGSPQSYEFTLSGIVKDAETGEALPFATLMIASTGAGTNSNVDGYFTLLKVPSDTAKIIVQYMGFEKTNIYLSPSTSKTSMVVELVPISNTLETVVIATERDELMKVGGNDVSSITMTPRKLELLPNAGEKDIMRAYQLMPGVSAANESSSGMYVRGGTPDQNLILYDGFVIYHVDHLYGFFSAFNANALKEVTLYKGGFESRFGGRISSVTEITGKEGNQKHFNIGGDLSLLSLNAYAELPIGKKFSSIVAYRRSFKGPIYNKIFKQFNEEEEENQPGSGPFAQQQKEATSYFYDLNAKFTYRPNERHILSWSIFNGTDKLDSGFDITTPSFLQSQGISLDFSIVDLTKYGNVGSSFKWATKWTPKLYGTSLLSYSRYYSTRERGASGSSTNASGESTNISNGIHEDNQLQDFSLKSDYQWSLFKGSELQFGASATYYDIDYTYAQNDSVKILDRHNKSLLASAYVQDQFRVLSDRVQILPGIRATYFDATAKMYWEPRLSLVANITSKLSLKAATGTYYQFANRVTREDILSGSREFWILSDGETVPVSSAKHYIAGLSFDQGDLFFSAEAYYKDIQGLSEYSLRYEVDPQQVTYDENFFTGHGYSKGIELLAQKKSGKFTGWLSYTLSQTRNQFDVYGEDYFYANQDVTHEIKWVYIFRHKRWNFSATNIYATGRPYSAPAGAYTIDLLTSTQDYFTVTSKNSLRLPDYHRMDFAVNYTLLANTGESNGLEADGSTQANQKEIGAIGFSIYIYNRKNVWYKQYSIVSGSIVETSINYLGITPNLTLSLKLR
jgi:ferric enterobactin receptor